MNKLFSYRKCKNGELFEDMKMYGFVNVQNYIPIYKKIFSLTSKNYNSINLNHPYYLKSIIQNYDYNSFQCVIDSSHSSQSTLTTNESIKTKGKMKKDVFIKTAPLLDPFKFVIGNYDSQMNIICNLPQFENDDANIISKLNEETNTSYNDNLFYFLTSVMFSHGFVHGIEYYGSFLAVKKHFTFKIFNEIEHIYDSSFFHSQRNKLFEIVDDSKYERFCQLIEKEKNEENEMNEDFETISDCSTGGRRKPKIKIEEEIKEEKNENDNSFASEIEIEDINVDLTYDEELGESSLFLDSSFIFSSSSLLSNEEILIKEKEEIKINSVELTETEIDKKEKENEIYIDEDETNDEFDENCEDDDFESVSSRSSCSISDSHASYDDELKVENEFDRMTTKEKEKNVQEKENIENEELENHIDVAYRVKEDYQDEEEEEEEDESLNEDEEFLQDIFENGIDARINEFPVQLICIEKCKNTLDSLIIQDEIPEDHITAAMIQIIFSLLLYQRVFHFTHNDLHTNNVMYIKTNKKYLVYQFEGKIYTVPTFGRIFKIIDFGRSIFTVDGINFCSDSYKKGEDAYSQYNFGCYYNDKKPLVEPNYSFDLCRLACSMFDALIPDFDMIFHPETCSPLQQLIIRLCQDDKQRNIMYKRNQEERYPDFKLYKMIARTVHRHTPLEILQLDIFQSFCINPPKDKRNEIEMNLDELILKFT